VTEEISGGVPARHVEVLVVGAGPAGLACATELAARGAGRVAVLERDAEPGGIPRHSHHTGFGVRDLHRVLSGPEYARRTAELAERAGATILTETTASEWGDGTALLTSSPRGLELISAEAIVLATGARERPRSARLVPGDRPPAGIMTTGELQQAVYLHGLAVGCRAVVVGAELVSYSAVLTLRHAGAKVVALVTERPWARVAAAAAALRVPLHTSATVVSIQGRSRVEAVDLLDRDGRLRALECDVIVFTGDWIPDHELARRGGLVTHAGTGSPVVDRTGMTSRAGVYAAGNLLLPVRPADAVARRARSVARRVLEHR
jgi:NADPH-dependent 2,4-dienoyl-CoA reductase/sulfur reductase-like enzyme